MSSTIVLDAIDFPGDPRREDADVARRMDEALARTGFMALSVPGLDARGTARARAAAGRFFARPPEEKRRFAYRDTAENFGYQWAGTEALDPSAPPDLKESFTMRDLGRHGGARERFPDQEFRAAALELHGRLTELAHAVMRHLALQLEVDRDFFLRGHSGRNMTLRFLHYPAAARPAPGQLGAGAHTDYGSFTLLLQDAVGGLQIRRGEHWVDVPPGSRPYRGEHRRPHGALEQRSLALDLAPRTADTARAFLHCLLRRPGRRNGGELPAELHATGAATLRRHHGRRAHPAPARRLPALGETLKPDPGALLEGGRSGGPGFSPQVSRAPAVRSRAARCALP
ncbi:MAG: 2-oxoglutarate and iron-dependent oxygenase domain-containing protein [Pseudomonadales bacterium]|jgi:hypothetical protein|nr:2-oxoglutarate and iron-dependent oxygenase domain-containing protein [Pseudomonadales bacterium]